MKRHRLHKLDVDEPEAEESGDLITQNGNCVYFYADVSKKSVLQLYGKLAEATKFVSGFRNSDPRVYLYIHSDGGCAYSALAAYAHLQHNPVPVTTIADGFCASAATLIFVAGKHRIINKHAMLLIHQLRTFFCGRYDELCDEYKNSTRLMASMRAVYKSHTSMPDELINKCLSSEEWLGCNECKDYEIAHEIR